MDDLGVFSSEHHGGQLHEASRSFGIPVSDWLDLSTGINPKPWCIPSTLMNCLSRLPEETPSLGEAIRDYYGGHAWALGAGTQEWIETVPALFEKQTIWLPSTGYFEHQKAWRGAGHEIRLYQDLTEANPGGIVVLINPNNPTGSFHGLCQTQVLINQVREAGGFVLIDEAFIDTRSDQSALCLESLEQVLVFRSIGKFFGLPGLRVGLAFGDPKVIDLLKAEQGPWRVNTLALQALPLMLKNKSWHIDAKSYLQEQSEKLCAVLESTLSDVALITASDYFVTLTFFNKRQAREIFVRFAETGILVRLFETEGLLRFGLPRDDADFTRLSTALLYIGVIDQENNG